MRRICIWILTMTLLLSMGIGSYAKEKQNSEEDSLIKKYELIEVDPSEVPEGVSPLELNTKEELVNYLERVKNKDTSVLQPVEELVNEKNDIGIRTVYPVEYDRDFYTFLAEESPYYRYMNYVNYDRRYDDYLGRYVFVNINVCRNLFDYSLNAVFEEDEFSYSLNSNRTYITITTKGAMYVYITYGGNTYKELYEYIDDEFSAWPYH